MFSLIKLVFTGLFLVLGRAAFVGLGFADRGDSFDLIVAIQDHFKYVLL
jgi:hypothetical protein